MNLDHFCLTDEKLRRLDTVKISRLHTSLLQTVGPRSEFITTTRLSDLSTLQHPLLLLRVVSPAARPPDAPNAQGLV